MESPGKINLDVRIDPDWGDYGIKAASRAMKIIVTPEDPREQRWAFFLLLPQVADSDLKIFCQEILEQFLAKGDNYSVLTMVEDDLIEAKVSPLVGFDPANTDNFTWMRPPKWMMS